METNLHNMYLFKALDAYPYELEKAAEALNYALSYEPNNVKALCLMAQMQSEQLGDYEAAKHYFELAIASNLGHIEIYPDYINTLLRNDDFDEAQKVIDFAITVKGIDVAVLKLLQGQLHEMQLDFEAAEVAIKEALQLGLNSGFISFVDEELTRVTKKRERHNHEKSKSKVTEKAATTSNSNWRNRLNGLL